MAFVFIIVGVILVTAGIRDKQDELWALLQKDFSPAAQQGNNHSFLPWFFAILVIGALGYIEELKPVSRAFLVLVIIVLFLAPNGFWNQFQTQVVNEIKTPAKAG